LKKKRAKTQRQRERANSSNSSTQASLLNTNVKRKTLVMPPSVIPPFSSSKLPALSAAKSSLFQQTVAQMQQQARMDKEMMVKKQVPSEMSAFLKQDSASNKTKFTLGENDNK
jgi:hypothetical protein